MQTILPPGYFTEESMRPVTEACQKAAKKAQGQNSKPKRRESAHIKVELTNLQQRVADFSRQLAAAEENRTEVLKSIDTLTARVAALRAAGVSEFKFQDIVGYERYSKAYDRSEHVDGTLEVLKLELTRLDGLIVRLGNGVESWTKTLNESGLEAELREAVRLEALVR